MTILSDTSILLNVDNGILHISPFTRAQVQPSSYDLTLADDLTLALGVFYLASSREYIELPAGIQGQVHGRSSIGRLGVLVHFTAGLIDPGFKGRITLECMALDRSVEFKRGDRIAQVSFHWLDGPSERPYNGRYQNQWAAEPSRFKHASDE